ncbi:MAG: hypothetical protein ABEH35_05015 [Haloarculaceae archaeon]
MVNESGAFGFATVLTVIGLAIMLYGVSLNNGQSLNGVMIAGGTVIVVAFSILTAGVMTIEGGGHGA